jgi:hypothetical protein
MLSSKVMIGVVPGVAVIVADAVLVGVEVRVGVRVPVAVDVRVPVGVRVALGVAVAVHVAVGEGGWRSGCGRGVHAQCACPEVQVVQSERGRLTAVAVGREVDHL